MDGLTSKIIQPRPVGLDEDQKLGGFGSGGGAGEERECDQTTMCEILNL